MTENPFLQATAVPNWTIMTPDKATDAITYAISKAKENIAVIKTIDNSQLTYENCVEALDNCSDELDTAWNWLNHLQSVADTPELRTAVNENTEAVVEFSSSITLDSELYAKISTYAKSDEAKKLQGYKARLLSETLLDFELGGANLPADQKARIAEIDTLLSTKAQKFSENVLDDTKSFTLLIDKESDLEGLPQSAIDSAKSRAQERDLQGWLFTLDAPSYVPFMSYSTKTNLREKLWRAFSRVASVGEHSNIGIMKEILSLRAENAKILDRANFADLVLERRMARKGKTALDFVEKLHARFKEGFEKEWNEILDFAKGRGLLKDGKMQAWTMTYVSECLRREKYGFDPEELRPYFSFENVKNGLFEICHKLYGVKIEKLPDNGNAWDKSVELYKLSDKDGSTMGLFYTDFFPRKSKRGGAWMNLLRPSANGLPALGVIAGNLSEPSGDIPALLTHDEVETLFHEFGHLLHFFMMNCPAVGLRDVAWDFVELPSQIMENWSRKKDCLDIFARHWQTGEKIPEELFKKFETSRKFMGATAAMRQLSFAKIDLEAHIAPQKFIDAQDIDALASKELQGYTHEFSEKVPSILPRFTHLFGDAVGYAAGYYSYKWAEVLDADAFTRFEREGVLNSKTGADFAEKILKVGNTIEPELAFKNFMGRDPDIEALVRRSV